MLSKSQLRALSAMAHHLNPVIQVGKKGITDALVAETDRALLDHELIKVKFLESEDVDADASALAERSSSEVVARRGKIGVLYRAHPEDPRIRLPKS